jgi:hypothetical protein
MQGPDQERTISRSTCNKIISQKKKNATNASYNATEEVEIQQKQQKKKS